MLQLQSCGWYPIGVLRRFWLREECSTKAIASQLTLPAGINKWQFIKILLNPVKVVLTLLWSRPLYQSSWWRDREAYTPWGTVAPGGGRAPDPSAQRTRWIIVPGDGEIEFQSIVSPLSLGTAGTFLHLPERPASLIYEYHRYTPPKCCRSSQAGFEKFSGRLEKAVNGWDTLEHPEPLKTFDKILTTAPVTVSKSTSTIRVAIVRYFTAKQLALVTSQLRDRCQLTEIMIFFCILWAGSLGLLPICWNMTNPAEGKK